MVIHRSVVEAGRNNIVDTAGIWAMYTGTHNHNTQVEYSYRYTNELWPGSVVVVDFFTNLLFMF